MSWTEVYDRMNNKNITDGSEYNNGQKIEGNPKISHTTCDYCGKEVLCVRDDYSSSKWYGYLGNQARRPNCYKYSPIIQTMRKYFNSENIVWDEEHGNNLMNLHARCHCEPEDWSKRAHKNGIKILCPTCFQKTYNRIKVKSYDGIHTYALSVVEELGETVESVMKDLDIKGTVIGKGGIPNYDM